MMNVDNVPSTNPVDSSSRQRPAVSTRQGAVSSSLASLQQGAKWIWRKKWLVPVLHSQFWFSACFSLIAPFYPGLAAQKGVTADVYGWVFSVFKLFMFIGSIASQKLIDKFGPVPIYVAGLLGTFIFDVCIGVLYWVNDKTAFIALSFPLAVAGGFVACSYSVSMYSMLTDRFSSKPGVIIASMEFLWGLGNMIGTMAGGILIDFWAFPLPFFTLGIIMILLIPTIIKNGPIKPSRSQSAAKLQSKISSSSLETSPSSNSINQATTENINYRKMILRPLFIIDMITVMFSWIVMSFNEPTLEPYLSATFQLSSTGIGLVFCVQFACYATGAIVSGVVSSFGFEEFFLFFGQFCTALAFLVLGPAPFVNSEPKMGLVYLSQVFTGVGMAAQFVCGFAHALKISIKAGFPDDIKTSGVVASATFICMVLGAIITPPLASHLVSVFGYRAGSMFIFYPALAWSLVNLGVFVRSVSERYRADNDQ